MPAVVIEIFREPSPHTVPVMGAPELIIDRRPLTVVVDLNGQTVSETTSDNGWLVMDLPVPPGETIVTSNPLWTINDDSGWVNAEIRYVENDGGLGVYVILPANERPNQS